MGSSQPYLPDLRLLRHARLGLGLELGLGLGLALTLTLALGLTLTLTLPRRIERHLPHRFQRLPGVG